MFQDAAAYSPQKTANTRPLDPSNKRRMRTQRQSEWSNPSTAVGATFLTIHCGWQEQGLKGTAAYVDTLYNM